MTTVILDSEAVDALASPGHPKRRRVLAHIAVVAQRKARGDAQTVVVPTSVRVEVGWDRTRPSAALINRLRIADVALDAAAANEAAAIRTAVGVSVADAHIGVVARHAGGTAVVLTSDPKDIAAAVGVANTRIVRI